MIIQGNDPYKDEPTFSISSRIRRQLWNIIWLFLFRPSPKLFYKWRNFLLKIFGAKLAKKVFIHQSVKVWAPWNLEVGQYGAIGEGAIVYSMNKIIIDDYAIISQGVHLCAGSHDYNSKNHQIITAPIYIGVRAWLCAEVFIGLGVSIAEGVVVGARSVVIMLEYCPAFHHFVELHGLEKC